MLQMCIMGFISANNANNILLETSFKTYVIQSHYSASSNAEIIIKAGGRNIDETTGQAGNERAQSNNEKQEDRRKTGFMNHELVSVTVNITVILVTHVGADEDRQLQLSCDAMLHLVICWLLTTLITQQWTLCFF